MWWNFFAKIVNGHKLLAVFSKKLHPDIWQGPKYASD